jgi:GR25 family glycosyltransferase involved in LPS biosynthesis
MSLSTINLNKAYIVSIERSALQPKRRDNLKLLKENLTELFGTEPEIFGVDGKKLSEVEIKKLIREKKILSLTHPYKKYKFDKENDLNSNLTQLVELEINTYGKRNMTAGEVGCFLSHMGILQKILNNKYERSLILEDDAKFLYDCEKFKIAINNLLLEVPDDFYMISIFNHRDNIGNKNYNKFILKNRIGNYLHRIHGETFGTVGYIISLKGASEILKSLYPLTVPYDYGLSQLNYNRKKGYVSLVPLVDACLYEETTIR